MSYNYPVPAPDLTKTVREETLFFSGRDDSALFENCPSREDILRQIRQDPDCVQYYLGLSHAFQQEFLDFCTGQKGLKITYDAFFKYVLSPELHPHRLERFLTQLLKEPVSILQILPLEAIRLHEGMALICMDIIVELESGALCNVEIQKSPYDFPGERAACYSAELLVRQYARLRQKMKDLNLPFSYQELSKVYTIVILEKSCGEFTKYNDCYIHRSSQAFDTGLTLNLLQEYIFISLDIFRNIVHNITNELEAWLFFLGSDKPADIARVIHAYPYFAEYYQDIFNFRRRPKELLSMFSKMLAEMDRDEYYCMIERLKEQCRVLTEQKDEIMRTNLELADQNKGLYVRNRGLAVMNQDLDAQNQDLDARNQDLDARNQDLDARNQNLSSQNRSFIHRVYTRLKDVHQTAEVLGISDEEVLSALPAETSGVS